MILTLNNFDNRKYRNAALPVPVILQEFSQLEMDWNGLG
jgi:hypothetical protein